MGPGHSSSLRIGGDSSAVSRSGRTGVTFDSLTGVVVRKAPMEPLFPWTRARGELTRLNTPGDRNI